MERCWDCHHDQVKLILDDAPVITDLGDGASLSANLHFDDVRARKFRLEFLHVGEDAGVRLQWSAPASVQLDEAKAVIAGSDAVVAVVGLSPDVEGEELSISAPGFDGGDRTSLDLPAGQLRLLEAAKASGKPLVVVLMSGGAVALNWAKEHADAIVAAWYPGEAGGEAIAATLSGANNPSGRLPVTFYRSSRDLAPFIDYRMTGRTYRYFDGETLYPFGFGLSYTHFGYTRISAPAAISAGEDVTVSTVVSNLGVAEGDEVAQVYLTPPGRPQGLKRSLVGFKRVHLKPGESRKVEFKLAPRDLSLVSLDGERAIEPGAYQIFIGGGQPGDAPGVSAPLNITGRQPLSH
jgi:beta-glucosidase